MKKNLYTLLEEIRKRPELFLGEPSLSLLGAFLSGYILAHEINKIELKENPSFRSFQSWVVMKLQSKEGNVAWTDLLLKDCDGDDERAFAVFFAWLEQFKNKEERIILWAQLPLASTPKTIKVLRSNGRYYRETPDYLLQIVEYSGVGGVFLRCLETGGKLKDEIYNDSLESGLEDAKFMYGIKKKEWQSTSSISTES